MGGPRWLGQVPVRPSTPIWERSHLTQGEGSAERPTCKRLARKGLTSASWARPPGTRREFDDKT
ncbi:hypothetical protein GCM10010094_69330 [Streptomyces flaveus]|uniref:Uncharacterized protein n=1 Tax=Streptomyces flaveus TaxID=66370 RepID=A0A917RAK7_9ACTN|nr:hypothetical protein GCM10010094_69330 [Streptomyces flaveus]